jgi:hypothetical protein
MKMIRANGYCTFDLAAIELADLACYRNYFGKATTWGEWNCESISIWWGI